jgi:hypothetical protein
MGALPLMVTVLGFMPTYELTICLSLFSVSVKFPSKSLTVAFLGFPFSTTVAPMTCSFV